MFWSILCLQSILSCIRIAVHPRMILDLNRLIITLRQWDRGKLRLMNLCWKGSEDENATEWWGDDAISSIHCFLRPSRLIVLMVKSRKCKFSFCNSSCCAAMMFFLWLITFKLSAKIQWELGRTYEVLQVRRGVHIFVSISVADQKIARNWEQRGELFFFFYQ